jgi:endoglucanase
VTIACTVQEEIGSIGAAALASRERFAAAIVVEVGLAGDIPGVPDDVLPMRLGDGPGLIHKDSAVHYDHALTRSLERCAVAEDIPVQHGVLTAFASDGVCLMRADVPTAMTVFPTRYTHTPFETAHLRDVEQLVAWLARFVTGG